MRLDATTSLPDGRRLRLRLPQAADRDRIAALHDRIGVTIDELELARALRFDPLRRAVVCAVLWDRDHETVVGWAAADRGAEAMEHVVTDEAFAPGVTHLLAEALAERARIAA